METTETIETTEKQELAVLCEIARSAWGEIRAIFRVLAEPMPPGQQMHAMHLRKDTGERTADYLDARVQEAENDGTLTDVHLAAAWRLVTALDGAVTVTEKEIYRHFSRCRDGGF